MTDSVCQKKALQEATALKESAKRRIDSPEGLVWAQTRRASWSHWNFFVEGYPRPRRVGEFKSTNIAVIKALVDALEPLQAKGLL